MGPGYEEIKQKASIQRDEKPIAIPLITPKVIIHKNVIDINILGTKFIINTMSNELFVEKDNKIQEIYYKDLNTYYLKEFEKKENVKRPKARCHEQDLGDYVFIIDSSLTDHRLFFLLFRKKDYLVYRGGPYWRASYFVNRYAKQKQWFERNLIDPKRVWCFGSIEPKTKRITLKDYN